MIILKLDKYLFKGACICMSYTYYSSCFLVDKVRAICCVLHIMLCILQLCVYTRVDNMFRDRDGRMVVTTTVYVKMPCQDSMIVQKCKWKIDLIASQSDVSLMKTVISSYCYFEL